MDLVFQTPDVLVEAFVYTSLELRRAAGPAAQSQSLSTQVMVKPGHE